MTHWEALSSKACGRAQETQHHHPCYLPAVPCSPPTGCSLLPWRNILHERGTNNEITNQAVHVFPQLT